MTKDPNSYADENYKINYQMIHVNLSELKPETFLSFTLKITRKTTHHHDIILICYVLAMESKK